MSEMMSVTEIFKKTLVEALNAEGDKIIEEAVSDIREKLMKQKAEIVAKAVQDIKVKMHHNPVGMPPGSVKIDIHM